MSLNAAKVAFKVLFNLKHYICHFWTDFVCALDKWDPWPEITPTPYLHVFTNVLCIKQLLTISLIIFFFPLNYISFVKKDSVQPPKQVFICFLVDKYWKKCFLGKNLGPTENCSVIHFWVPTQQLRTTSKIDAHILIQTFLIINLTALFSCR